MGECSGSVDHHVIHLALKVTRPAAQCSVLLREVAGVVHGLVEDLIDPHAVMRLADVLGARRAVLVPPTAPGLALWHAFWGVLGWGVTEILIEILA